jgi:hypothetical protein
MKAFQDFCEIEYSYFSVLLTTPQDENILCKEDFIELGM